MAGIDVGLCDNGGDSHHSAYSCARCSRTQCMTCDRAVDVAPIVKTIVRYCPDWRCQREKQIEGGPLTVSMTNPDCKFLYKRETREVTLLISEFDERTGQSKIATISMPLGQALEWGDALQALRR